MIPTRMEPLRTECSLAVFSEQDLNKSDKFWKRATQHRWREVRVTPVRYDRGSGPSSARTETTLGCSRPIRSSRLNRDFSRRADLASRRNEVKPRAPDPRCL